MKLSVKIMAFFVATHWVAGPVLAADPLYQSHESLQTTAVTYALGQADRFAVPPQVVAGQLDQRLRLARCDEPLATFESPGGLSPGRSVVGVRCNGTQPWKLFVPVEITLPAQVVALTQSMRRGEIIRRADVTLVDVDLAKLHGDYFLNLEDVVGQRLKRNVAARLPLKSALLDTQRLIKRGAEVTIVSDTGSIQVRMRGKALGQGGKGDRIQVKNERSGRVLTAIIVDRGVVRAAP